MHYGEIITADCANGPGIRVSLFVSGCTNCCKGCFQPETWDFNYGAEYTKETEDKLLSELKRPYYQGLTILGGEPFEPENQPYVAKLIRRVREDVPDRDIWIFTGFTYESDLLPGQRKYTEETDYILDNIDMLVDGKFILEKKNLMLKFRGSENQRIIDMISTRKEGKVVLSELN
ncbi:MAG: anaerobic ribonucleoside-triphosphate reductase activating protein [Eubacterium sp.]|nr:anaerobic ribonucleoside-triphosphate reductase activating protein [Eubacterium sp.]